MAALGVLAAVALLAANGTSQLDCVCSHIHEWYTVTDQPDTASVMERVHWEDYCVFWHNRLVERCDALEEPSSVLPAVARLLPWGWQYRRTPAGDVISCGPPLHAGGRECDSAAAAARGLTWEDGQQLLCPVADALTESCSAQARLNDTEWTAETLTADHLRHQKLSQLLDAARGITRAMALVEQCVEQPFKYRPSEPSLLEHLDQHDNYWRRAGRLLPLLVTHLSQLFVPLAFQHMGNHTEGQQLRRWIKNVERVRDMLDMKLRSLVHEVELFNEEAEKQIDKSRTGEYIMGPTFFDKGLLLYEERILSFSDDFGALCEQQLPQASQVFDLADALYSFYCRYFIPGWSIMNANITDEEWQLEDQSNTTVWVDTGCLQLLVDTLERPRCPLEELPPEASRRRRQCREQLWRDLVERPPRPPVTSYLAYNERADVSLCLLAWMAANSRGLCQDVPISVVQSVHDARCYFDRPHNQTCLYSNTTESICYVSRALLLLKCHHFSSVTFPNVCAVEFYSTEHYSESKTITSSRKLFGKATERTLSYKQSLNSKTLKYKDFKVDILKPLEYTFIAINVFFRLSTASVYMWLPHLGNVPGKILLSFQLTGISQVLCSEVLYRMLGFPDLSTAVLVDSSLTLLGCLWLNTFCFQMYVCVRDLRLPNHLTPAEASMVFRRQLRWALIPWGIVSTACAALEKFSKYYLMHSRITLIVAISTSVAFNLGLLGIVAFIYFCNKKSMRQLNITGGDKGFSKKQLIFMTVNTIIFSGICVIIRIGFHQAKGIAQYVYYVHMTTMMQGPVLFVFFACNGTTLPVLTNRLLALWRPDVYGPELELCSAAKMNLARRRGEPPPVAETSL